MPHKDKNFGGSLVMMTSRATQEFIHDDISGGSDWYLGVTKSMGHIPKMFY